MTANSIEAGSTSPDRILRFHRSEFQERFNRLPFQVSHALAEHPAFALPRLVELAALTARTRPLDVYYDDGIVEPHQRWVTVSPGSLPIDEAIRRIETERAWIMIWRCEMVAPYDRLLNQAMSDILEMTGREVERRMKKREVILFISSPNRVTPYHIDRECNFLLQIWGRKDISVFPKEDRELLPETEIEAFWTVDNNAAVYRKHLQHRAKVITMEPGTGVHIPVNAPHWVQNFDNVSVTASFNFQFHDSEYASLYRANYYLRKFGLNPRPPFLNAARDAVKRPLGAALYRAHRWYRGPTPRELATKQ